MKWGIHFDVAHKEEKIAELEYKMGEPTFWDNAEEAQKINQELNDIRRNIADAVQSDTALAALADQLQYCIAQGQYPNAYWDLTVAFGTDINAGTYKDADDATLTAALKDLEDQIKAAK